MMENYWPTAGEQPNASKHDIEHSRWYNKVAKVILSKSMRGQSLDNTTVISDDVGDKITALKQQPGKDILIFGSPTAAHTLMKHDLIDDFWLFVNPVLLGSGTPMFSDLQGKTALKLLSSNIFPSGVIALHYQRVVE